LFEIKLYVKRTRGLCLHWRGDEGEAPAQRELRVEVPSEHQRAPGSIPAPAWARHARARATAVRRRISVVRSAWVGLVRRYLPNETQHLFALTLVIGVLCGLVAVAFHLAITTMEHLLIDRALTASGSSWMAWTIATPAIGGLAAGAALHWIVPGARGSGIPQVKQAFATEGGRIKLRDAVGKFIIGAFQIGSGASLGREGPTVQICAGATSALARLTSLPPRNMRRLTPVGVAAGIAAAFNAPIAAVTFTIEEIVGTLDHAILSGVVVAAALAAVIERGILGTHPVIAVAQAYGLDHASSLLFYAILGVLAAFVSVAFTDGLLKVRARFRAVRAIPAWTHPGVGGLATGVIAVVFVRYLGTNGITGGGYDTLGLALEGQLGVRVLLALCVAKLVATVLSYSSGGAGGIFAPSLFVGAMLGGAVGHLDVLVLGHESRELGAFALVGMGAVFAGVVRAPITSVLIIFEMTGGYGLVLPLMLANMTAFVIARRLRPTPIYEALLAQDGVVLPHAPRPVHPLEQLLVSDAMTVDVVTTDVGEPIVETAARVVDRSFASLPVVDGSGAVLGVVRVGALRAASAEVERPVRTLMRPGHTIRADATLLRAIVRMNDLGVRQLYVTDALTGSRLVGVLSMSDLMRVHARSAGTGGMPVASRRPHADAALRAELVMSDAPVMSGAATVGEVTAAIRGAKAVVVRLAGHELGVVLPEHVTDLPRDAELQRMLIAADLARNAPSVSLDAGLTAMIAVIMADEVQAVVVIGTDATDVRGVVTRSDLAMALLEWYATQAMQPKT